MVALTTHILDTAHGCPAVGVTLRLRDSDGALLSERVTNADGRCDTPLLTADEMRAGRFRLEFEAGDYFRARGIALAEPAFLDRVIIDFGIAEPDAHYHVPLLISPFGYSTYRGS